jgi:hypothetical protein
MLNKDFIDKIEAYFSVEELCLIDWLFREKDFFYDTKLFDEKKLLNVAEQNGLSQLLYKSVYLKQLTNEAQQFLKEKYFFNLGKNAGFQLIANEIAEKLLAKNIPVIFLKGISHISCIYKDIALRPMSDIDIMVPSEKVYEAWQIINNNPLNIKRIDMKTSHHLPGFNYHGINIELHRFLFPSDVKYVIPINEIWEQSVKISEFNTLTLNPIHQFIYLLLHIYYSYRRGVFRLGWFYDIKHLFDYNDNILTLDNIEFTSKKWNIYKPIRQMLIFFSVLCPDNKLSLTISAKDRNEIIKIIKILHISGLNKTKYGYSIALERFYNAKGLKNKWVFLYNVVTDDGNGNQKFSFKRINYLIANSLKYLWRKK